MVVRWWRRRETGWRRGLLINGVGAATTGVIALIVIDQVPVGSLDGGGRHPAPGVLMLAIRGHYRSVDAAWAGAHPEGAGRPPDRS